MIPDWAARHAVPGAARPSRLYGYHLTVPQVLQALSVNNSDAGGGFYSQGGQFYYVRGLGLVQNTSDINNIVIASNKGTPIRVRDVGDVTIGMLRAWAILVSRRTMKITTMRLKA